MNYVPDEHRIRLFDSHTIKDSFVGLWNSIANQHHFLKLTFSESPTKEQIDHALVHCDGSSSPYSLGVFDSYKIIYQKKGTIILTNPPSSGSFFAVEDTDCPHRYFVGFTFYVGSMMESVTGLFVYFNEKGYCYSDQTIVCQRVLATYDRRNGSLSEDNVFLYHQTLLFLQIHQDTHKVMLFIHHIPYSTESIEDHTSYYTNLTTSACKRDIQTFHRFLLIPLLENKVCILDMGSLHTAEDPYLYHEAIDYNEYQIHRYFVLHTYTIDRSSSILGFLEVASLFPEKEYSDGYPITCIKCYQKTVSATYSFKLSPPVYSVTTSTGLGSSYCPECRIRYSDSKKSWVCAEVRMDGMICGGYFHTEWECQSSHLHSVDQTLLTLYDSPYLKYPYRKKIRLQWMPCEDAIEAVKMARMTPIIAYPSSSLYPSSPSLSPPSPSPPSPSSHSSNPYLLKEECP